MCGIVKKYFIYVVCILLGGILCTYALCNSYNWAMKINQTTYRVVIPKIFEEIMMEELKQEKVVVIADTYLLEEENYDIGKSVFESLFDATVQWNNKSLSVLSEYMSDIQELDKYTKKRVDLSEIKIPAHAGCSSIKSDSDRISNRIALEMMGLSELEPFLSCSIYLWGEQYNLNIGTPVRKMNYVLVVGDKLLFCSSTIEGKMNQKGNYQIYTASIQDNKK